MSATNFTIALPDSLRAFVQEEATRGGYSNADEFVRSVLEAEQRRRAEDRLKALLREGLQSETAPLTAADWDAIRQEGQSRLAAEEAP
jgi:antitoxin ParD1/3/4